MNDVADIHALANGQILTRLGGGIRWLVFNQPEKLNAVSLEMSQAAADVIEAFGAASNERVLVVRGAGEKAFVSGADISEFDKQRNNAETSDEYGRLFFRMFQALRDVEKPTLAMIQGYCFGGGVALASCCDIRLCADNALFAVPAARLGVGYRAEFVEMLMNLVGPAKAKEILYAVKRFPASEALAMGLVNQVTEVANLEKLTLSYADNITANAPLSLRAAKVIVNELLKDESDRDTRKTRQVVDDCANSEDFKNARRAFMAKEKPIFTGK
jgi:enoyl-CoA hydratase